MTPFIDIAWWPTCHGFFIPYAHDVRIMELSEKCFLLAFEYHHSPHQGSSPIKWHARASARTCGDAYQHMQQQLGPRASPRQLWPNRYPHSQLPTHDAREASLKAKFKIIFCSGEIKKPKFKFCFKKPCQNPALTEIR